MLSVQVKFNRFPEIARRFVPLVDDATKKAGRSAADRARAEAPVITGTLRDSIEESDGEIRATAPYAGYVEYGTVDTPAQPFIRPGFEAAKAEYLRDLSQLERKLL